MSGFREAKSVTCFLFEEYHNKSNKVDTLASVPISFSVSSNVNLSFKFFATTFEFSISNQPLCFREGIEVFARFVLFPSLCCALNGIRRNHISYTIFKINLLFALCLIGF